MNKSPAFLTSAQVREKFIQYFKKHQHAYVESSSLIPHNDPTLLFANAGMNQFKNVFLGLENRDYNRAVSSQKCVRAGGKHNDLENVGFTARHHTFFEMLGNFSFGDYFKKEAIHFAWDFLTRELAIPKDRLYVTVHLTDDEAAEIWHQQEGIPKDRIFRFDQDNFWRMGETGPCGPCTEIFYDHGAHAGKESDPFKGIAAGEDRFVEIWNLVFMQFYESAPGEIQPLPKPSVDTGSGLERVVAAIQGKLNNYDTDLFWPMIEKSAEISNKSFLLPLIKEMNEKGIHAQVSAENKKWIAALRVVADHIRSSSFLIADGALPSNEGRGYVLRRILRRAIRFSQMLSGGKPFLPEIADVLIQNMKSVYPELELRKSVILSNLKEEQDRFIMTLETGTVILNQELQNLKNQKMKQLPGSVVFKLYDTYGFPADLTELMAEEEGFEIDHLGFEKAMSEAKSKAKASWKGKGLDANEAYLIQWSQNLKSKFGGTDFVGYSKLLCDSLILGLSDGKQEVSVLKKGQTGFAVVKQTPFYAEGGGQVGDLGEMKTTETSVQVFNCTQQNEIAIHHIEVLAGEIKTQQNIQMSVDTKKRKNTAAHHSATHLLHSALRKVLGTHVTQAGQLVDDQRIRFDFTHSKALTNEEIKKIESLVNDEISSAQTVKADVMKHQDAIKMGAMALFGEKYGDQVRVLKMGEFSTELCGGTHVHNTAEIRLFRIVSESGVSSGVRRIEALAGDQAIQYAQALIQESLQARKSLGLEFNWEKLIDYSAGNLAESIERKKEEVKKLEKEIKKIQGSSVDIESILEQKVSFQVSSIKAALVVADLEIDDRDVLAQVADQLKNKISSGIVVVLGSGDQGFPLIVSVTKDLNPKLSAGQILKNLAQAMGGKGGGRPDFAQGSVPDRKNLEKAIEDLRTELKN